MHGCGQTCSHCYDSLLAARYLRCLVPADETAAMEVEEDGSCPSFRQVDIDEEVQAIDICVDVRRACRPGTGRSTRRHSAVGNDAVADEGT